MSRDLLLMRIIARFGRTDVLAEPAAVLSPGALADAEQLLAEDGGDPVVWIVLGMLYQFRHDLNNGADPSDRARVGMFEALLGTLPPERLQRLARTYLADLVEALPEAQIRAVYAAVDAEIDGAAGLPAQSGEAGD